MKWAGPNTQIENEIKNLKATVQKQPQPKWLQIVGIIGAVVAAITGVIVIFKN